MLLRHSSKLYFTELMLESQGLGISRMQIWDSRKFRIPCRPTQAYISNQYLLEISETVHMYKLIFYWIIVY